MNETLEKLRGKLLVFEGYDKTGKSSVAKLLADTLNSNDIETVFTFQPGDTAWGTTAALTRSLCIDKRYNLHPLSNLFAFLLDRTEQVDKIVRPALEAGKTVISDRWWHSTIAYQFHGKELLKDYLLNEEFAFWLNRTASLNYEPDYVFYFPETLDIERPVDENDQFEIAGSSFSERVKSSYNSMAGTIDSFVSIVPGSNPLETLKILLEQIA